MSPAFRSFHPLPCFAYYAGVAALSMLLFHPVFLATSALAMAILNVVYGSPGKMLRTMALFLAMGAVLFVINPVFSHRGAHILFEWLDQPVTLEAVLYGLTMTLSPLSILFAFLSYNRIVGSDRFLYLFGAIWPKGSLTVVMAMRFVPLLNRRLGQIAQVQRAKGISLSQGPLADRVRGGMKLLQILLTWSLEDALQTADSMKARGYGAGPRSSYVPVRMRARDWLLLSAIAAGFLICAAGRFWGYGVLTIYPRLETMRLAGEEWLFYAVFVALLSIPLGIEGKEWLAWRSWKSTTYRLPTPANPSRPSPRSR